MKDEKKCFQFFGRACVCVCARGAMKKPVGSTFAMIASCKRSFVAFRSEGKTSCLVTSRLSKFWERMEGWKDRRRGLKG